MSITPWSWQVSNGNATDAQTQSAYNAIMNQRATVQFSAVVWNDLVDKIVQTQQALNKQWNNYYGTSANTKINPNQYLMANKFNAVTQNIDWPYISWWMNPSKTPGYIGRQFVKGVSSYGYANADYVYGWYILELTYHLNIIIGVINGTQPVEQLVTTSNVPIIVYPSLNVGTAKHLTSDSNILLEYYAKMKSATSSKMSADKSFKLNEFANLHSAFGVKLQKASDIVLRTFANLSTHIQQSLNANETFTIKTQSILESKTAQYLGIDSLLSMNVTGVLTYRIPTKIYSNTSFRLTNISQLSKKDISEFTLLDGGVDFQLRTMAVLTTEYQWLDPIYIDIDDLYFRQVFYANQVNDNLRIDIV